MTRFPTARPRSRVAAACLVLALAGAAPRSEGQCQVLSPPAPFDPSGVPMPTYFQGTQDRIVLGGPPTARRLMVLYNYGFLVYDVTTGTPVGLPPDGLPHVKDLLGDDNYPKNGDGVSRTGNLSISLDGQRALVPWTDIAGYGSIALSQPAGRFTGGGDFAPKGSVVVATAVAKTGARYIGFAAANGLSGVTLYAADLTTLRTNVSAAGSRNSIPSEPIAGLTIDRISAMALRTVESATKSYLVGWGGNRIHVGDVTNPGAAVPVLSDSFTWSTYTAADFGLSVGGGGIRSVSAAFHPTNGELYFLVEGITSLTSPFLSAGSSLARVNPATGGVTVVGTVVPPVSARYSHAASLLIPSGGELLAIYLERDDAGLLQLHVRSSADFSTNAAAGLSFSQPLTFDTLAGFAPTAEAVFLYMGTQGNAYKASLQCAPAAYALTVNKIGSGSGLVSSSPPGLLCGPTCSEILEAGATVTLEALPTAGSRFAGWSGSGCSGTGSCTVLMTAERRVTASFLPEAGTGLYPVTPCRIADTRGGSGIPLSAGEVRVFPVVGPGCGVSSEAQAVALNVTATQPASAGFVTVHPSGAQTPGTLTVAFSPGRTRAAPTIVPLGEGGAVSAYNASDGPVHLILDVSGVFR